MPNHEYSFRLTGLDAPNGEISMRDLVEIGGALHLTTTRIARQIAGQDGRGRSTAAVDRVSELRLSGVGQGSTVLEMHLGDAGTLHLQNGDEELVATRFEEIVDSIASNQAPTWANRLIIDAVGKVADRIAASGATSLDASRGIGSSAAKWRVIEMAKVDFSVWRAEYSELAMEHATVTGRLDKVDLRARRFRVRDDVGNDIALEDVVDIDAAAHLIGQRVVASGVAEQERGRTVRIVEPVLHREELPAAWFESPGQGVPLGGTILEPGIDGVSAAEVDEFLAELRV